MWGNLPILLENPIVAPLLPNMRLTDLYGLTEGSEEDELDDDELDMKTDPRRSFSNPFDSRPSGKVIGTQRHDVGGMSRTTKPSMAPPAATVKPGDMSADAPTAPPERKPITKPPFKGSFVGQVHHPGGAYVDKKAAWQVKGPQGPEWRRRNVQGFQKHDDALVWDGQDWVTSGVWDAKVKTKPGSTSALSQVFQPKKP